MKRKKIIVTGSSGTIGTRLCEKLLEKNHEVIGIDYCPNKWSQTINKITFSIDLRNKEKLFNKLPKNVDLVIHLAANARVYDLTLDPSLAKDNIETTFHILEYCRQNKINQFMFASSREVYGNSKQIQYKESEVCLENCESPYSASKLSGEAFVYSYHQCYGIDFVNFRFSNVYGMYDDSDRVIPLFIRLAKKNKDLTIFGKEKLLDFTYIDDTISGILSAIENFQEVKNNIFNLAYGEGFSILKLAELIKEAYQSNSKIILDKGRTGEVIRYIADISKAKKTINYSPKTNLIEGVKKTLEWYDSHL